MKTKRLVDEPFLAELRKISCVICAHKETEIHHIKTRGSGGGDYAWNCIPVCRFCHQRIHQVGMIEVCKLFPHFLEYIQKLGWYFDGRKFKHAKN